MQRNSTYTIELSYVAICVCIYICKIYTCLEGVYMYGYMHTHIATYTHAAICSWNSRPFWELSFGCWFVSCQTAATKLSWLGSPELCGVALLATFNLISNENRDLAEPSSILICPQIRSAVVPSGCGAVLKLRAALIWFTVCTVEAVLGLLGNYWYVPHSSKLDISFPRVVMFGFM